MNIGIIGFGKMGKEIASIAKEKGHNIALTIDYNNEEDFNAVNLKKVDVAIEFSSPESALRNIKTCIKHGVPVVSGTTGWLKNWDELVQYCKENDGSFFYGSNFSIGVNILFAINEKLASIMDKFPAYDISMEEIHHIHKLDAPSGTAISLADQILSQTDRKENWQLEEGTEKDITISCKREGEVHGYHKVIYDSEIDTIEISHDAKSRKGFAQGAVMAAEYLIGKKGLHSMKDLLQI